ncbi:hypothetical protein RRG08_007941 [Elysia crispata]|uniref:Uncharacterized protein n=1 Tax=Elysia crispata TaxID=231223 RepID=A0AAE0ZQC7_9GAST|nr:hypothetical protein RRG08_007941 [Elysia crispata]
MKDIDSLQSPVSQLSHGAKDRHLHHHKRYPINPFICRGYKVHTRVFAELLELIQRTMDCSADLDQRRVSDTSEHSGLPQYIQG